MCISKLSNVKVKWNGEGHLKVDVVVWGVGSQNRPGPTPRREVDESNYRGQGEGATPPLRAAHSTEPKPQVSRSWLPAAMIQLPDAHHMASPRLPFYRLSQITLSEVGVYRLVHGSKPVTVSSLTQVFLRFVKYGTVGIL